jgi:two-component sensor histidine kinase
VSPDEHAPLRLLYIDDDGAARRLVQRRMSRVGIETTLASTGAEGVALLSAGAFDVIALDHYMPGRDGLDVLGDLRALAGAPPVVFVTAAEEPRIAVTALKQGAADFVVKDIQGAFLELLEPTLRQAVAAARMQRAKEQAEQELRESRDRLERLAAQQAVLLREVNHRVANSLQLISAMIALQARRLDDGQARDLLRRAAERVDAVALIHRRLYTSNDVEFVEMDQYLQGLVAEFRRALETDTGHDRIELKTEPVRVETDKAVSIGLIVNELVTNALKYAYPAQTPGPVRIWLTQHGNGLRLGVEDDGIGFQPAQKTARGSGVGGMIVAAMADTLKATISHDPTWPGTRFILDVPG